MKGKKTGGRIKGVPNKLTPSIREMLTWFVQQEWPGVKKAFGKLSPYQKVIAFSKILPFVAPQYQSISFNLKDLPEQDLQFVLEKLKEQASTQDNDE